MTSMFMDGVVERSASPDDVREKLISCIETFAEVFPNWQDAYGFAEEFFVDDKKIANDVITIPNRGITDLTIGSPQKSSPPCFKLAGGAIAVHLKWSNIPTSIQHKVALMGVKDASPSLTILTTNVPLDRLFQEVRR